MPASPVNLRLESDTWEKAGEPFPCDWCGHRVEILDIYWTACFSKENLGISEFMIMKVCADCASAGPEAGPPLETVMP